MRDWPPAHSLPPQSLGRVETVTRLCREFGEEVFGHFPKPRKFCEKYTRIFSGQHPSSPPLEGWTGERLAEFIVSQGEISPDDAQKAEIEQEGKTQAERVVELYIVRKMNFFLDVARHYLRREVSLQDCQRATNAELTGMAHTLLGLPVPTVLKIEATNGFFGLQSAPGALWPAERDGLRRERERRHTLREKEGICVEMPINPRLLARRYRPLRLGERWERESIANAKPSYARGNHEKREDYLGNPDRLLKLCENFASWAGEAESRWEFGETVLKFARVFSGWDYLFNPPVKGWTGASLAASLQRFGLMRPDSALDPKRDTLQILILYLQAVGLLLRKAEELSPAGAKIAQWAVFQRLRADLSHQPTEWLLEAHPNAPGRFSLSLGTAPRPVPALRCWGLPVLAAGPEKVREEMAGFVMGPPLLMSGVTGPTCPLFCRSVVVAVAWQFMEDVRTEARKELKRKELGGQEAHTQEAYTTEQRMQELSVKAAQIFCGEHVRYTPQRLPLTARRRFLLEHSTITRKGLLSPPKLSPAVPPLPALKAGLEAGERGRPLQAGLHEEFPLHLEVEAARLFEAYFQTMAKLCLAAEKRFQGGLEAPAYEGFRHSLLRHMVADLEAVPVRRVPLPPLCRSLKTRWKTLLFARRVLAEFPGQTRGLGNW